MGPASGGKGRAFGEPDWRGGVTPPLTYKVFDRYAERYDSWYRRNPILFKCEAKVIESLNLHGRGLSVGVGTGTLDLRAPIDVGVEPSLNMLRIAHRRNIEVVRAVGEHLPFKDESFDFVLMTVTLCFLDRPEEAMIEARRVLHPQGVFAVCIIPKNSTWGEEYMKRAKKGHPIYSHAHFYTVQEVEELLKRCSFEVVAVRASLSYSPHEEPIVEEPSDDPEGRGFICLKAVKV